MRRGWLLPLALLPFGVPGACARVPRAPERLEVCAVGASVDAGDPDRGPLSTAAAIRRTATEQGLVRLNARGEIEPGLARRWIVSDDGLSTIFRLDRAGPTRGERPDAGAIARRLKRAVAAGSRNPLKPVLGAVETIASVTPEVIEVRLRAPRPNLLQLLARPELGVGWGRGGSGPLTIVDGNRTELLMEQRPGAADPGQARLRAAGAGRSVARFATGGCDMVLGGTAGDLPVARAAGLRGDVLRIDPAAGLFGLRVETTAGILATPAMRARLSAAIDRDRLVRLFGAPGWTAAAALVPRGLPDDPDPAPAAFGSPAPPARGAVAILRVALPPGPGGTLIAGALAADWRALGLGVVRVGWDAPADLRLVDEVAAADNAAWWLRHFACGTGQPCDAGADAALTAARVAPSLETRAAALAAADRRLAAATLFMPIATPLRWSLVRRGQAGFETNRFAIHPLAPMLER